MCLVPNLSEKTTLKIEVTLILVPLLEGNASYEQPTRVFLNMS